MKVNVYQVIGEKFPLGCLGITFGSGRFLFLNWSRDSLMYVQFPNDFENKNKIIYLKRYKRKKILQHSILLHHIRINSFKFTNRAMLNNVLCHVITIGAQKV